MKAMESLCKAIVAIVIFFGVTHTSYSQVSKSLSDTLAVNDIESLSISNQYGDIVVSTWDQDQIGYDVQIVVLKDDTDVAEDLLERLVYSVEEFNSDLKFDFEVQEMNAGFFERLWSDITLEIDQSAIQINAELTVPKDLTLDITNKFGDITIRDWSGDLTIKQKHGDVKVSGNVIKLRLNQSFGDADFNSIDDARIEIRNVEFRAKRIEEFNIESHGSEIILDNAMRIVLDSNKDDLTIDQVNRVKGSINYGSFIIEELVEQIQATLKLTDLTIKNIVNEDADITIDQTNSEIDINLNGLSMDIDATLQDGLFKVPEADSVLETTQLDDKEENRTIIGSIGANPKGKIVIEGKKGVIIIRE